MKASGFVFYHGPSEIDGSPIVGIATFHSSNRKTGDMVQTWIMRDDVEPHIATKSGDDYAVCGDCPLRPSESGVCYVLTFQGPLAIYRAFKAGRYPDFTHAPGIEIADRMVRMGSYGDPAAIPRAAWEALLQDVKGNTGYTHQWRDHRFAWLSSYCQASCDNPMDVRDAVARGWKTFYVVPPETSRRAVQATTGVLFHDCPAVTGRKSTTCNACGMCNGRRAHIVIDAHGAGAKKLA